MTTTQMSPRAGPALVTGAATALYYATPDFIASRTARGWAKAGLMAINLAAALPDLRAARAAVREQLAQAAEAGSGQWWQSIGPRQKVAASGSVAAVVVGAVGLGLVAERWVFSRGQARAATGVRLPHTRAALGYGLLAAGFKLLPTPPEPRLPIGP
ncbi:MAG TPA: hypothetical protein VN520_08290 [Streptomyces sp.]|uniref:hypothetical protein n=1 Tax=Streptomyces sp. TaxID=1931 RepID=UPI002C827F39|nr:hypothetical protein [Streptomyces sp.]HWU06367.1 hypothetical protein [Streptomyces sp.]